MDDGVNQKSIQKYLESLLKRSVSPSIIQRKLNALKRFVSWAREQNKIDENIFSDLSSTLQKELDQIGSYLPSRLTRGLENWLNGILRRFKRHPELFNSAHNDKRQARMTLGSLRLQHYIGIALVLVLMASLGAGAYNQFFNKVGTPFAFPATPTKPSQRYVSFQGRVTDSLGNPITTATNFQFKLYNAKTGGSSLFATGTCSLTPDQDGILNVLVGGSGLTTDQNVCGTGIPENIFSDFPNTYLGITIGADSEATPRQQIANVGYAVNAETLQGFPPGKDKSTVPYLDLNGDVLIATAGASIKSLYESANFTLASSNSLVLQAAGPAAGAGDIILQATGSGALRFRTAGATDTQTRLLIANGGNVGIGGDLTPDSALEILSTTGPQFRISYTDASVDSQFTVDSSGNLTIDNTGTKTIVADDLQINGGDILDSNGNEYLRFTTTASAVDEITITNAATGGISKLAATGGDTDVELQIDSKGADALSLNNNATGDVNIAGTSVSTGCTVFNATGNLTCAGTITGVGAVGYWTRATTTLSPATANDVVSVSSNDTTNPVLTLTSTGASANAALITADSTTTGNALGITANGLSSGNILSLTSTSTAAASNTQTGLNISLSGTNGTSTQTTYGAYISNVHAGTASTNVGLYATASGGTTANYAAIFDSGRVGIKTTNPIGLLTVGGGSTGNSLGDAELAEFGGYIDSPYISIGEYQNYLLQTEQFGTTWVTANGVGAITNNSAVDPRGSSIAENIGAGTAGTGEVNQAITDSSTGYWTFSVWLRAQSGTPTIQLRIDSSGETGTALDIPLTTAWKRYAVTQNLTVANTTKTVRIINGANAISAFGAQFEPFSQARRYSGALTTTAVTAITRTAYIPSAITMLGALAGATTGAFSNTVTDTQTALAFVSTDSFVSTNTTAATAVAPIQTSPRLRLTGTVWNPATTASVLQNFKQEVLGTVAAGSGTSTARLIFGYMSGTSSAGGYSELMNLDSSGELNVLGTTIGTESLTNPNLTSGTSWTQTGDMALTANAATYTHSTGAGTLSQASGTLAVAGVANRWYQFTYTTSTVTTGATAYIDTTFALNKIYLNLVAGTYTVRFKSAVAPGNFTIQVTSTAGAFTIDTLSLKEVQSGNIAASGLFTGGGTVGIKIDGAGNVGIGTTGPDSPLDVLSTGGSQIRATYTDGTVYTTFNTDSSGNLTIDGTGTKSIIADDLQINGGDILDSNGNEYLRFTTTASAVNEITITNAATGGISKLAATGGDTDVELQIDSKGADALSLNNNATGDVNIAGTSVSTGCTVFNATGNLTCAGIISGSGVTVTLNSITAAGGTSSIDSTTNAIVWNWNSLTTQTGMTFGSSATGLTTGTLFSIGTSGTIPTYAHTAGADETGNLTALYVKDNSSTNNTFTGTTQGLLIAATTTASPASGGFDVLNGLNIDTTINSTSANTGTKTVNVINVSSPTLTACTGGNCNWTGINLTMPATTASYTLKGINLAANTITTDTALNIANTGTGITTAGANTGSLLNINASGATAAMTGSLASINFAGTAVANTGALLNINSSGAAQITQSILVTNASTGTTPNGLVRFNFTGARTAAGAGFQIDDISTTLATVMTINGNSLTTGNGEAQSYNLLTTGKGSSITSSSNALTSGNLINAALTQASIGANVFAGAIGSLTQSSTFATDVVGPTTTGNTLTSNRTYILDTATPAARTLTVGGANTLIKDTFNNTSSNASANTLAVTGNVLSITRDGSAGNTGASQVVNISGALVAFTDNALTGAGTKTHSGSVLTLTQSNTTGSGNVLSISGLGTGNLATLDATNASANGVSIDVQSSSSSQYALNVTSNNAGTNLIYARADGNVGIGTATPASFKLQVAGDIGPNVAPTQNTLTTVDSATSTDTGQYTSIYCVTATDCKIAYFDNINNNLMMADCDDATCATKTLTTVDSASANTGQYTSIYCVSSTDCKISYYDVTNTNLMMADCDDATCATKTLTTVDSVTSANTGKYASIYCVTATDCKIAYQNSSNNTLMMADCDDATCATKTLTTVDSASANTGQYTSIYCVTATDCKIAYFDNINNNLMMADCDDATCATKTLTTVDSVTSADTGKYTSIYCVSSTDCKIAYFDNINNNLMMADCDNSTCSTKTLTTVDSATSADTGQYTSIYCVSSTDCKISYYDVTNTNLMMADCDDATCSFAIGGSNLGSNSAYFNSIFAAIYYGKQTVISSFDIAENYKVLDESIEAGDIVTTDLSGGPIVTKSDTPYQTNTLGVISTKPGITLADWGDVNRTDMRPVALAGRVPVKVTSENGGIKIGDPVTSSSTKGFGMKASQPGAIVGKALEKFDPENISESQRIACPERTTEETSCAKILVLVNLSWYDPQSILTSIENMQFTKNQENVALEEKNKYNLLFSTGEVIKRIGAFSELASAYIKAGFIHTEELLATNITSTEKIVSPVVETKDIIATGEAQLNQISTNVIKPQQEDITVDLTPKEASQSGPLARILVKGLDGKIVTTIDSAGNASFSGTLAAKEATISGKLFAKEIESNTISDLKDSQNQILNQVQDDNSSISELRDRLTLAAQDSGQAKTTSQELSSSVNNIQSLLADIRKQPLSDPQYYQNLDNNPVVSSLVVSGDTTLYNATIANSLTVGTISIKDDQILSQTTELRLSALSSVNILDGAVVISRDGTMTTKGTIIAKGGIEVQNSDLRFKNSQGVETASIDASGSAKFKTLALDKYLDATSSAIIASPEENFNKNGLFASAIETQKQTAGVGIVPINSNEIVIYNQTVKDASLIYLTPTTQTSSQLTVTQKQACGPQSPSNCKQYFKVTSNQPIHPNIGFNWLIIN